LRWPVRTPSPRKGRSIRPTVTDETSTATLNPQVSVSDGPLTVTSVGKTEWKATKTFNRTLATFTDADPNGTLSDYTATIDWGDGQTTNGTIAPNHRGGWSVSGSHTYASVGRLAITVTVNDTGGATANTTTQARVK